MRPKGAGYYILRYATRLARFSWEVERRLGRKDLPPKPTNPNGLEEAGTVATEDEAQDLCRIIHRATKGRYAVTYTPLVVGRVYPFESVMAAGDRYFDPFKEFDFSATDAVKEQAKHVLVSVDDLKQLTSLTDTRKPTPRL
jgi:hypothetical protein